MNVLISFMIGLAIGIDSIWYFSSIKYRKAIFRLDRNLQECRENLRKLENTTINN